MLLDSRASNRLRLGLQERRQSQMRLGAAERVAGKLVTQVALVRRNVHGHCSRMRAVLVFSPFRAHPTQALVRNAIRRIRPNDGRPCALHGGARQASCAHAASQTPCASQKGWLLRQPRCLTPDKWSIARSLPSRMPFPNGAMQVKIAPNAYLQLSRSIVH